MTRLPDLHYRAWFSIPAWRVTVAGSWLDKGWSMPDGEVITLILTCLAAGFALIAAVAWFISTRTISREQELERRRKAAVKTGEPPNLGGVSLMDGDTEYDLIATLRHQGQWNRWGAGFAAAAALCQAITLMPLT